MRGQGPAARQKVWRSASVIARFAGVVVRWCFGADGRTASEPQELGSLLCPPIRSLPSAPPRPHHPAKQSTAGGSLVRWRKRKHPAQGRDPCIPPWLSLSLVFPCVPFSPFPCALSGPPFPCSLPSVPAGGQRAQLEGHPEIYPGPSLNRLTFTC